MRIEGELTYANANARWVELSRESRMASEIDVSGITKIDSAGLAVLTSLRRTADEDVDQSTSSQTPPRRLLHATPEINRLATAYGVSELFA